LERNTFTNAMQIMPELNEIHMDIPLHKLILVFDEWKHRFIECIEAGGDYL
jgi:hypothetical protein